MGRLRVLIADDHDQMRSYVATLLAHDFEVVGSVKDGRQLIGAVLSIRPDVVVTDMLMPRLSGLQAMKDLRSGGHCVPFVLISSETSESERWIEEGVSAVVKKIDMFRELVSAVRCASSERS